MTTTAHHRILIVFLALFSVSLALSKSAANVVLTLTYLASLVLIARYREYRRYLLANINQPLIIPLLAYLAVTVIGIIYTEKLADGLGIANKVAGVFLVYFMTSVVIDAVPNADERTKFTDKLILIFIAGIFVLDTIALMTYLGLIGDRKFTLPVYPLHVHHIWFANLNAVGVYAAVSFLLFGAVPRDARNRTLLIVFVALAVFSILLSISRTAWLGMIVTGIVLTYLLSGRKRVFVLTLAMVVSGCLLAYYFIPLVHDRVNAGFSDISRYDAGETATSLGDRFVMWKAAAGMFLSNPLFGVGTGDYMSTMREYAAAGTVPERILDFNQPHNMYLFSLATNGFLGLGALLFIFYRIFALTLPFKEVPPERKQLFFLATAVAVHYLVAGMTDSLFNIFIIRSSFAFVMGMCIRTGSVQPAGNG